MKRFTCKCGVKSSRPTCPLCMSVVKFKDRVLRERTEHLDKPTLPLRLMMRHNPENLVIRRQDNNG